MHPQARGAEGKHRRRPAAPVRDVLGAEGQDRGRRAAAYGTYAGLPTARRGVVADIAGRRDFAARA
ncbi:hypothetical protein B1K54_05040 [Streptomyces sp. fd1-xmd]|nr:hypothetical protein B1K54_05040 [Streptomyces sp. fd1-xmd]